MSTSHKFIIVVLGILPSISFANVTELKAFEAQLISKYEKADFYDVNMDLEEKISKVLAQDTSSFQYNFQKLQDAGFVGIKYSPDKKLKFYTFDVGGGGTMGEYSSYVQYQHGKLIKFDAFDSGYVSEVDQIQVQNSPVYLIRSVYKGDNCNYSTNLNAVEYKQGMIRPAYIFFGKNNANHEINIEFNCQKAISPYTQPQDYLNISNDNKFVDIMLLNKEYIPQNRFIRYTRINKGYQYTGTIKP